MYESAVCIASREAARVVDWEAVPCGSKSFSPRRGRVCGVGERLVRRRKSWVSSVGSGEGGCWVAGGEGGGEAIVAVGVVVIFVFGGGGSQRGVCLVGRVFDR